MQDHKGDRAFSEAERCSAGTRTQLASLKPGDQNPGIKIPDQRPWAADPTLPIPARDPQTCDLRTGPGGHSEGQNTRSHPELGRENPQRQWYCVSRRGRVGRRQAHPIPLSPTAGWSSPVARQAHNLKVRGSNPLPATNFVTSNEASLSSSGAFAFVAIARMSARRP
jgi:hypothetical protein